MVQFGNKMRVKDAKRKQTNTFGLGFDNDEFEFCYGKTEALIAFNHFNNNIGSLLKEEIVLTFS